MRYYPIVEIEMVLIQPVKLYFSFYDIIKMITDCYSNDV
jgi:hypothetical protein